jgi:hypothetical protein
MGGGAVGVVRAHAVASKIVRMNKYEIVIFLFIPETNKQMG